MSGKFFIGTSGWNYLHWWNGVFYPSEVKQNKWLEYYAQYFDTVEINSTFYRIPREKTVENWRKRVPDNFTFVVKASRIITHLKKLEGVKEILFNFLDICSEFKEKLGPILFQTPPLLKVNKDKLQNLLNVIIEHPLGNTTRIALEFRNKTWFCDEIFDILKSANSSLCFSDMPEFEIDSPVTADFVYIRKHGKLERYASLYSDEELKTYARDIKKYLKENKDVYVFFNNDAYGYAVKNAMTLIEYVK